MESSWQVAECHLWRTYLHHTKEQVEADDEKHDDQQETGDDISYK